MRAAETQRSTYIRLRVTFAIAPSGTRLCPSLRVTEIHINSICGSGRNNAMLKRALQAAAVKVAAAKTRNVTANPDANVSDEFSTQGDAYTRRFFGGCFKTVRFPISHFRPT